MPGRELSGLEASLREFPPGLGSPILLEVSPGVDGGVDLSSFEPSPGFRASVAYGPANSAVGPPSGPGNRVRTHNWTFF